MNVMDDTIAGATSGETASYAAPKDSQSQVKGQKTTADFLHMLSLRLENVVSNLFLWLKINGIRGVIMEKRAVVTVVGKDQVGIISKVTTVLAQHEMNIHDISQTILQDYFTMMMLVEMKDKQRLEALLEAFEAVEDEMNLTISIQLEDVFQAMHRI